MSLESAYCSSTNYYLLSSIAALFIFDRWVFKILLRLNFSYNSDRVSSLSSTQFVCEILVNANKGLSKSSFTRILFLPCVNYKLSFFVEVYYSKRWIVVLLANNNFFSSSETTSRPSCIWSSKLRFSAIKCLNLPRIYPMYVKRMLKIVQLINRDTKKSMPSMKTFVVNFML